MPMTSTIDRSTTAPGGFARFRRTRRTEALRRLVRETALEPSDFVYPLFVTHGEGVRREIGSMPGQFQLSLDRLGPEVEEIVALGIGGVLLFGLPETKDALASGAYDPNGVVQGAVRAIKGQAPELLVVTDVCCCEYTDHGHCGVLVDGEVHNDRTLDLLARAAVSHAAGHEATPIMSYSAKYASGFYGPFREAADSTPRFGDRRSHQMDPANAREALREIAADVDEGADLIIVKPALAYLDVVARAREEFRLPIAAYNVSGEYAMVKAAAANGWIDERRIALEILTAIKRAGADILITYHAKDAARWLEESRQSSVVGRQL
jgi:porphobilinogen synthase